MNEAAVSKTIVFMQARRPQEESGPGVGKAHLRTSGGQPRDFHRQSAGEAPPHRTFHGGLAVQSL